MRILLVLALTIGLVAGRVASADTVTASSKSRQAQVTLTLSDRLRGEFVDWFKPHPAATVAAGAHRYDFVANQLRAGMRIEIPHLLLVAEAQDTRLLNLPSDASLKAVDGGNLGPGAAYFANTHDRDQGEIFVKQGYLTATDLPGLKGISLTGGRFEYSDGMEAIPADPALAWLKRARVGDRLIGPFGFTHVTRSHDGVRAAYDTPDLNVTALGTKPTHGGFEVSANRELTDVWLAGLALTLKQLRDLPPADARLLYFYYRDGRDNALKVDNRLTSPAQDALRKSDHQVIEIHTWGAHAITVAKAGPGKADGLFWGVLQSGNWGLLDHFAWAYAVETGYQLPALFAAPWLRFGYDRSSGDGNPDDKSHKTFFQPLPTARVYAQFPFFNLMNNEDLFAQLILKPHPMVTVRSDYHWLRITEPKDLWYSGGGATNDDFFGFGGLASKGHRELAHLADVGITVSPLKQLTAYAYYGHAFGQGVVKDTFAGAEANFGYLEITYRY